MEERSDAVTSGLLELRQRQIGAILAAVNDVADRHDLSSQSVAEVVTKLGELQEIAAGLSEDQAGEAGRQGRANPAHARSEPDRIHGGHDESQDHRDRGGRDRPEPQLPGRRVATDLQQPRLDENLQGQTRALVEPEDALDFVEDDFRDPEENGDPEFVLGDKKFCRGEYGWAPYLRGCLWQGAGF